MSSEVVSSELPKIGEREGTLPLHSTQPWKALNTKEAQLYFSGPILFPNPGPLVKHIINLSV